MRPLFRASTAALLAVTLTSLVFAAGDRAADPLARAIESTTAYLRANRDTSDTWQQVREASGPMLERSAQALREGRRTLALQRLAAARLNLSAYAFMARLPERALRDSTGLAAGWVKEGDSLAAFLGGGAARAAGRRGARDDPRARLAVVRPAAVRALAEMALPQIRNYYDAALDYGYSTEPRYGWYYVGVARAQRDFFALCLDLAEESGRPEPAFRSIAAELDSLHARVLAAYRPPLSIDRHPDFIGVSSVIKEARELDAAGLPRGALLRYLVALQRFGPLHEAAKLDSSAVVARLAAAEARMRRERVDHSIGELFLDAARSDLAIARPGEVPPSAVAIATEVLPLYFAALEPAPAEAARRAPEATVTLVRWPYT